MRKRQEEQEEGVRDAVITVRLAATHPAWKVLKGSWWWRGERSTGIGF